ncbi:uncharacterized protein THITE_116626 [Thermothielavioides terrestris NRRL 8126]|uniref:Uncharacterized protein n=1 Tax=Thermothielavioides terrestris (strain ATCC 38088 / NRRL 8126) TaxID=578455 RepID=G2RHJ5_THETT|nr:uncharacterized protein THITE_116626 [Thermothielavioides terrestris NRRL 8126]AEO71307.1 hypothetical protein THITE_116626 [Thermothielavioides terrestris NRRL 8126]
MNLKTPARPPSLEDATKPGPVVVRRRAPTWPGQSGAGWSRPRWADRRRRPPAGRPPVSGGFGYLLCGPTDSRPETEASPSLLVSSDPVEGPDEFITTDRAPKAVRKLTGPTAFTAALNQFRRGHLGKILESIGVARLADQAGAPHELIHRAHSHVSERTAEEKTTHDDPLNDSMDSAFAFSRECRSHATSSP